MTKSLELHTVVGTNRRHRLPFAADVSVRETLNGQYYVTFRYPRQADDLDRYEALVERNQIVFPDGLADNVSGQRFVIKSVSEVRSGKRIYKQVEAHHVAFELNRYYLDEYIDFEAARPPEYLLTKLGNDTPFTMQLIGNFTAQDVWEFGEKRKHALLNEVRSMYDGELTYDNYTITLTTRAGFNYGASVRYRKNLSGITRKSHDMERITRLYGYGKNGLTIEGYAGHTTKYIDSQYYDANHPYEDSVTFADIDTQAALLAAMQKYLKERELPKVTYDIDFVQLEKVDGNDSLDAIRGVGDTVTVRDEELGFHFDARVVDYERYPFEPKKARVVLANFREFSTSDYVWQATVGSQKAIKYTSKNAVLKGVKYDDSITLVDGMGMAVSDDLDRIRVRLGQVEAGEYGLTLYNKAGAKTLWLDATTGDAMFSGNIVASNFRTNPDGYPFVELSSDNNVFKAAKSATAYIEIEANPTSYAAPIMKHVDGGSVHYAGLMGGSYFSLVSGGNYDIGAQDGTLRLSGNTVNISGTQTTIDSNVYIAATNDLVLNSTSRLFFGITSLSSILNGIYSRLSALESA